MAYPTYTIPAFNINFAANKIMSCVYNGSGSGKIIGVPRVWLLNNQIVALTGVLTTLELRKITSCTGGADIVIEKHDTNSADLPSQILIKTGATCTLSDTYRRVQWATDEPRMGAGTIDEIETLIPLCNIWNSSRRDSSEILWFNEGEGLAVVHNGNTSAGNVDVYMELLVTNA